MLPLAAVQRLTLSVRCHPKGDLPEEDLDVRGGGRAADGQRIIKGADYASDDEEPLRNEVPCTTGSFLDSHPCPEFPALHFVDIAAAMAIPCCLFRAAARQHAMLSCVQCHHIGRQKACAYSSRLKSRQAHSHSDLDGVCDAEQGAAREMKRSASPEEHKPGPAAQDAAAAAAAAIKPEEDFKPKPPMVPDEATVTGAHVPVAAGAPAGVDIGVRIGADEVPAPPPPPPAPRAHPAPDHFTGEGLWGYPAGEAQAKEGGRGRGRGRHEMGAAFAPGIGGLETWPARVQAQPNSAAQQCLA